jgi:hypothetical protein
MRPHLRRHGVSDYSPAAATRRIGSGCAKSASSWTATGAPSRFPVAEGSRRRCTSTRRARATTYWLRSRTRARPAAIATASLMRRVRLAHAWAGGGVAIASSRIARTPRKPNFSAYGIGAVEQGVRPGQRHNALLVVSSRPAPGGAGDDGSQGSHTWHQVPGSHTRISASAPAPNVLAFRAHLAAQASGESTLAHASNARGG